MRYISLPVVVAVYFIAENKNPPVKGGFLTSTFSFWIAERNYKERLFRKSPPFLLFRNLKKSMIKVGKTCADTKDNMSIISNAPTCRVALFD
jgi:hypothetical protein